LFLIKTIINEKDTHPMGVQCTSCNYAQAASANTASLAPALNITYSNSMFKTIND
jgi:hypothetical protein